MTEFYNVEHNKYEFGSKWIPKFWITVSIRWLNRLYVFRKFAKTREEPTDD